MSKQSDNGTEQVLCKTRSSWTPLEDDSQYDKTVELSRLHQFGNSLAVVVPQRLLRVLCWKRGDRLCLRVIGDRVLIERIPMERLALLRKPAEVKDAQ